MPENYADGLTRRQLVALTGAGATAGLAGCFGIGGNGNGNGNGGGQGTEDPTQLPPVHVFTDYNNDAWQKQWEQTIAPGFKEDTSIEIEMEYAGFSGQNEDRLATLIQSGDPPAVQTSTFEQVGDVWASDGLEDVGPLLEKTQNECGEMSSVPFHQGDQFWEVPHGYYTSVFTYRQDVYDELGLEVPTSFAQLVENARVIDESDLDIRGYGLAGQKTGKSQDEFQSYLATAGAQELKMKNPNANPPEAELWFPEEESLAVLNMFQKLANYSPDPTGIGWGESLRSWASGNFAQQYNLNVWPAGVAAAVDDKIAKNTRVAPLPFWKEGGVTKDDSYLSNPTPDGHHIFSNADNTPGGRRLMEWMYAEDINRTAQWYGAEPTRFLPNYKDIVSSDTFTSFDHWQQYPKHLEMLKYVQNTIVADYYNNVENANVLGRVPEAVYYYRFFFQGEMVNQVIAGNRDPKKAYDEAYQQAQQRLKEGKQRLRDD